MTKTLAQEISTRLVALNNCIKTDNVEWQAKHRAALDELDKRLPSGSGLDIPPTVARDAGADNALAFYIHGSYHHMNDNGCYVGWSRFRLKVEATFDGLSVDLWNTQSEGDKALWDEDEGLTDAICERFDSTLNEAFVEPDYGPDTDPKRIKELKDRLLK